MFNQAINNLVEHFKSLPGIGEKTAQRLAFFVVKQGVKKQQDFAQVLATLQDKIFYCQNCQNFSDHDLCDICNNYKRNKQQICVISTPFDVIAIEKTHAYSGHYHVLHGVLSPIAGITPQHLKIEELINRLNHLNHQAVQELIFALPATMEGEATAHYIKNLLPLNILITYLARGLPSGSSLEYADEITLTQALRERR